MKRVYVAEEHPSVGLVGAYGLHGDGMRVMWRGIPFPRTVVTGREASRLRLLQGRYVFGAPTATLVRSDFVRKKKNFYDESNLHADSTVCFRILQESDFGFVHQLLTFTRIQGESNTTFAERMNSIHLSFLTELIQYGPTCLDEKEHENRLEIRLREYYQVLAEGLLQMRGKNYFEFNMNWVRNLGFPLSSGRLLGGFCKAFWKGASNPVKAMKSLFRWWSKTNAPKKVSAGAQA